MFIEGLFEKLSGPSLISTLKETRKPSVYYPLTDEFLLVFGFGNVFAICTANGLEAARKPVLSICITRELPGDALVCLNLKF